MHEMLPLSSIALHPDRSATPGKLSTASMNSNLVAVNISSSPSPRIINLSGITTPRSPRYKNNVRTSQHLENHKDAPKSKYIFGDRNDVRSYFQKICQSQTNNFSLDIDVLVDYIKLNNIQNPEELYSKRNEPNCPQKDTQFWSIFKSYQRNQTSCEDSNDKVPENTPSCQIPDTIPSSRVHIDSKTEANQREKSGKRKVKESKSECSESDTTESVTEPEFTRLSSLAKLAANINLISMDISDKSGSESFDVESDELNSLGNIGELLLPSEGEWNILPGTFVELKGRLGKGATATVYSGIIENRIVAIKQIKLSAYSQGVKYAQATIQREYQIVKELRHPNILRYYGLFFNKENQQVNLIMELVDGVPLTDFVIYVGHVNEDFAAYILRFVLDALGFLHNHGIMHRDIKPDNVLMSMSASIKLIDFGTAVKYTPNTNRRNSTVGTPWYCAPEVINGEAYDTECDVWSLGCFAVELVSGKPPFDELNEIACLYKMAEGQSPPLPPGISSMCASFLSSCFISDWKKRPTVQELSTYPFISSQIALQNEHKEGITKIIAEMSDVKAQHFMNKLTKNTQQNFHL